MWLFVADRGILAPSPGLVGQIGQSAYELSGTSWGIKSKPQARSLGTTGQLAHPTSTSLPAPGRPLLQPPLIFQARPHFAFPAFLPSAQTPRPGLRGPTAGGGVSRAGGTRKGVLGVGMSMQLRSDGEGRKRLRPFTSPTHLRLQVAPQGTPPPEGHSFQPPLFGSSPGRRPCDPAQPRRDLPSAAPHGSRQLLGAALPSSPTSWDARSPTFPGRRDLRTRCPPLPVPALAWTCRPPLPSQPPRLTASLGTPPSLTPRGPPSSPECARNSPVPPPPSPLRPRAGSALWAGRWAPASWSWPSGPCCLAELSLGRSTARGSPRQSAPPDPLGSGANGTAPASHWLGALLLSEAPPHQRLPRPPGPFQSPGAPCRPEHCGREARGDRPGGLSIIGPHSPRRGGAGRGRSLGRP